MSSGYYHLSGALLAPGSIIKAGNWGRIIRHWGWQHNEAMKEMALEDARRSRFAHRPSRLDGIFVFLDVTEARNFRQRIVSFASHILYRVSLTEPSALSHVTDTRLSGPQASLRHDWADVYWMDFDPATLVIPGFESWQLATNGYVQEREMITLSDIRVEEVLV
jgi:hypothetical protein